MIDYHGSSTIVEHHYVQITFVSQTAIDRLLLFECSWED